MDQILVLCRNIYNNNRTSQRDLASFMHISLGSCNHLIQEAIAQGFIIYDIDHGLYTLTEAGMELLAGCQVDGAVILASGFSSRFVSTQTISPKGMLTVNGERMIERQIRQLQKAGISDITVVAGYRKEKFDYLIDKYQIRLIYNPEYDRKGTLAALWQARDAFEGKNMYLFAADLWMRSQIFQKYECYSWVSAVFRDGNFRERCLSSNKKGKITGIQTGGADSFAMMGPAYFTREFSRVFFPVLEKYYETPGTERLFWEDVYADMINGSVRFRFPFSYKEFLPMPDPVPELYVNQIPENDIFSFENRADILEHEEFRTRAGDSAIRLIKEVFHISTSEIEDFHPVRKGSTNNSFVFHYNNTSYICRIPGEWTAEMINRRQEKDVYSIVKGLPFTEHIVYMSGDSGGKISHYYKECRNADPNNMDDVRKCMDILRKLHDSFVRVSHTFDIRERIDFYENACDGYQAELFMDYWEMREKMDLLLEKLSKLNRPRVLSHIDSTCNNFLFLPDGDVRLIDWEFAGMCDPLADVSMFALHSFYGPDEILDLLSIYLERDPVPEELFVYRAYLALGGFFWSLWASYKSKIGEDSGIYSLKMYRYAKDYFNSLKKEIGFPEGI